MIPINITEGDLASELNTRVWLKLASKNRYTHASHEKIAGHKIPENAIALYYIRH